MARHVSDFKKNSLAIVLDLINADNKTAFTQEQLSFSDPVAGEGKATTITVTAKQGSGYKGSYAFNYNRVALTDVPEIEEAVTHEYDVTKFSDVLAFANQKFGLNLSAEDVTVDGVDLSVEDPAYTSDYDEVKIFDLAAKVKSLVWLGNVGLSLTRVRTDLSAVWTNQNPDGLYAPQDQITYPEDSYTVMDSSGNVRTTSDGSIRTFAGIPR